MTYLELQAAWAQYSHRDDIATILTIIEEMTRSRIGRDAELRENEVVASITHDDNLPTEFVCMRSVTNNKQFPLSYLTPQQYEYENQNRSGVPTIYTMIGGVFKCGAGTVNINYFERPSILINDGDTNAVLTAWPSLYLYAGAAEIKRWSDDEDEEEPFERHYQNELFLANKAAAAGRIGDIPTMRAI